MNVFEVATLYKGYVDENDPSWHSDVIPTYLKLGYADFRKFVNTINPWIYGTSVDIDVNGYSYDLANAAITILGKSPTNTKLSRLLQVWTTQNNLLGTPLEASLGPREQYTNNCTYRLENTVLHFSSSVTKRLRLFYIPQSTVNWGLLGSLDDEYIDDLDEHHELIAIYAAMRYGARDEGMPLILDLKGRKEQELNDHIFHFHGEAGNVIRSVADSF